MRFCLFSKSIQITLDGRPDGIHFPQCVDGGLYKFEKAFDADLKKRKRIDSVSKGFLYIGQTDRLGGVNIRAYRHVLRVCADNSRRL